MQAEDLKNLVEKIMKSKYETSNIEIKAAAQGCPKKLYDTLSAFSNRDDGGIIIFGIDESSGFELTGVYDTQDLQKQINNQCKEMEPIVRPLITVESIDGKDIVSAEIPGIEISERPCYYKGKGKIKGSYIRCGDSDEPMTDYEIYSYEAYRKKYQDDIRTVEQASFDIIDALKLDEYKIKCKKNKPNLARITDEQFDELMSITRDGKLTLASVILFGIYPQAIFPQLSIIATAVVGTQMGELSETGERFADNRRIEGTVSDMIDGAMQFIRANIKTGSAIDSVTGKRIDVPEYPMTAVREVIVNAIVHRDYSIHTQGMPIQITVFSDRIEVKNPGGLYGILSIDQLGKTQPDTRNSVLATAMETLNLTENRYSGIPTIRYEMKKAGLPDAVFEDNRGTFCVTLYNKSHSESEYKNIVDFCKVPRTKKEIADFYGVSSVSYAISKYIKPLIVQGKIDISNKEHPNSSGQLYYKT